MTAALDPFSMLEVSLDDNNDMDIDHPMNVVSACYDYEDNNDPEIEEIILPQINGIERDPLMTDDDVLIPSDIEVVNFSPPRSVIQVPDSHRRNDAIEALKTVSFGEHSFRQSRFPVFSVVAQYRLHCTMCDIHIGCAPNRITTMFAHVHLRVLICQVCYTNYNTVKFLQVHGSELNCRWCGKSCTQFKCSTCPSKFCASCILRNFGSKKLCEVQNKSIWKCFICNIKDLWPHRAICWAIQGYLREQKRAYDELRKKGVRHGLEHLLERDSSQCCSMKKPSMSAVPPPPPAIPISSSPLPLKIVAGGGIVNRTAVSQQNIAKKQFGPLHNGQTYISSNKTQVQAQGNYVYIPANSTPPNVARNNKHLTMQPLQSNVIVVDDDDVQCLTPVEDNSIWLKESIVLSAIETQSIANAFKDFETRINEGNNSVSEISDLTKRLRRLLHSSVSELREIDMTLAKNFNSWAKNKFVNVKNQRQAELDSQEQESGIPDSFVQQSLIEGNSEINLKACSSNQYVGHCSPVLYNHLNTQLSPPVKKPRKRNPQQKRNVNPQEVKKDEIKCNGVLSSVHNSSFNYKESPAHQYYKIVYAKLFKAHNIRDCRVIVKRCASHLHKV